MLSSAQWGQLMPLFFMAIALGMDAFSLGIGVGLKGIRKRDILKIGLVIGLFHIIMPLMGVFMGQYMSNLLGHVTTTIGGLLLLLLGAHMIYSAFRGETVKSLDHRSPIGLILFALSVSIDSFSVGISLGIFSTDIWLTVLLFGAFGGAMSIMGLLLGRRVGDWVGETGEALGGVILLVFGIVFLV